MPDETPPKWARALLLSNHAILMEMSKMPQAFARLAASAAAQNEVLDLAINAIGVSGTRAAPPATSDAAGDVPSDADINAICDAMDARTAALRAALAASGFAEPAPSA